MKKIVMAFGAFDGIHAGHLYYLQKAKNLGNFLIVSIARDNAHWKFTPRYHLKERERKHLIEMTGIADKVILGSKTDALFNIKKFRPHIIVLTKLTPVNPDILQHDLKKHGLKGKVVVLNVLKPEIYAKTISLKEIENIKKMGLPPKKVDWISK